MKNSSKTLFIISIILCLTLMAFSYGLCDEKNAVQNTVEKYYNSIKEKDYGTAYSLLSGAAQKYYGTLDNYISTFKVGGIEIVDYKVYKVEVEGNNGSTKTVVTYTISGAIIDEPLETAETFKDTLTKENGKWKINGKFGPYKSISVKKSGEKNGLKIIVYAIDLYSDFIRVNVSFNNLGKEPLMILPYNENTTLTYENSKTLPTVDLPFTVDSALYAGITLEADTKIVGFINFDGRWCKITQETIKKLPENIDTAKIKPFLGKEYPKETLRDKLIDAGFSQDNTQLILDASSYEILPRDLTTLDLVVGGNVNLKNPPPFNVVIKDIQL